MEVKVEYSILKKVEDVFDAIVDPEKINKYFVSKMVGKMVAGETIEWIFEDVGAKFDVEILNIVPNQLITFQWQASGQLATVNIQLTKEEESKTKIKITEGAFDGNENGVQKVVQQTIGWTDFICSMKAFLYAGVNLRSSKKY